MLGAFIGAYCLDIHITIYPYLIMYKYEKCQPSGIYAIPPCVFNGDAFKFHKLATADGLETILRLSD